METFVVLLSLGTLATAFHFTEEWNDWKQEYGKQYPDNITELRRFAIWQANKNYIDYHNVFLANHLGFTLGLNEYSDLDSAEFVKQLTGAVFPPNPTPAPETFMATSADIPFSVDWRTEGYVTSVKNQRHHQCGSCWAFSATGALEGQHFKATGNLISLSEQNLVDCSQPEGNQGCHGGWPTQAFQYVINNRGIDTEASYPYVAREEMCQFSRANIGATASSYVRVQNSEVALTQAIAEVGPISVCIDAAHARFQHYKGGVYYEPSCSTSKLNHCVLAVGYGRKDGKDMYIVKNSYGKGWGMKGYIFMSRNRHNNCGIASYASYPNVTPRLGKHTPDVEEPMIN